MSIVSVGDLVRRLRRELEDEPWEDYLTNAATSATNVLSVNQGTSWAEGDIGEFNDDSFEQVRVHAPLDPSTLDVKRGHNDTPAVAHAAEVVLLKNPKVPGWMLVNVLEETAAELWPWAWVERSVLLTPVQTKEFYTLPADFIDLISVTQKQTGTTVTTYANYGARGSGLPIGIARGLPVSDVGSGNSLHFRILDNIVNPITVRYRAPMTLDDAEDGLMSSTLVWGAMTKLSLAADTMLIRQTIPQNAISGLRQSLGYLQRFEDVRRTLHLQLQRTSAPARVYVG